MGSGETPNSKPQALLLTLKPYADVLVAGSTSQAVDGWDDPQPEGEQKASQNRLRKELGLSKDGSFPGEVLKQYDSPAAFQTPGSWLWVWS